MGNTEAGEFSWTQHNWDSNPGYLMPELTFSPVSLGPCNIRKISVWFFLWMTPGSVFSVGRWGGKESFTLLHWKCNQIYVLKVAASLKMAPAEQCAGWHPPLLGGWFSCPLLWVLWETWEENARCNLLGWLSLWILCLLKMLSHLQWPGFLISFPFPWHPCLAFCAL